MTKDDEIVSSKSEASREFVCVWRQRIAISRLDAFLTAYGPEGKWVQLFRKSPDFLGTELLQDQSQPTVHVTIDRWKSARAYRKFRTEFAAEYLALDTILSELTEHEELIAEGTAL